MDRADRSARDVQIALAYEEALERAFESGAPLPSIQAFVAQMAPGVSDDERAAICAFIEFNLTMGDMRDVVPDPVPPEVWQRVMARLAAGRASARTDEAG